MTKAIETYVKRRGRRYLIKRNSDGTFGKWIALAPQRRKKTVVSTSASNNGKVNKRAQAVK
jgi:hypothetical protein